MGGGSGSAPAQPSTTTQIQDIPEWEQGYVTNLLGQAQTIAAQPYQQFPGPEIAGFTPDQTQAFSNIENMPSTYQPTMDAAVGSAAAGANTAGGIYNAGAGQINAASSYNPLAAVAPYLGAASQYNSAAASQPWLNQAAGFQNAAANAATPQGIQSYMSPYTNSVVQGLEGEANQNWNQNIMPGVNDKFVGSGQYGSGRNAQVLGQAAGNFQTGLSANVANALETGYNTAGQQAQAQAGILGNLANSSLTGATDAGNAQSAQIGNLINQANVAGTGTQNQASNLLSQGNALGSLAATQAGEQASTGTQLGALGNLEQTQGLAQNNALQAVGQQQQQLNQSNLTQAQTDWQNQVNWPASQTEYLNQIIRGLPAPTAVTTGTQGTPAYTTSPLTGLSGSLAGLLGSATSKKEGGLIKGYAEGGVVEDDYDPEDKIDDELDGRVPLDAAQDDMPDDNVGSYSGNPLQDVAPQSQSAPNPLASNTDMATQPTPDNHSTSQTNAKRNPLAPDTAPGEMTSGQKQQQQLLAMSRAMLAPQPGGDPWAALGAGWGAEADTAAAQNATAYARQQDALKMGLEREKIEMGKFMPIKDAVGNVTGVLNTKEGTIVGASTPTSQAAAANSTLTGDDYLKTLTPLRAANAKAASEGRLAISPFLLKTPYGQQLLSDTMQYDPSFDTTDPTKRSATVKAFSQSGKAGQNLTRIDTAINTLSQLYDANAKLGGPQYLNSVRNLALSGQSDPNLNNYNQLAKTAADEVAYAVGGGTSTDSDRKSRLSSFTANQAPEARQGAIETAIKELNARLDPLAQAYTEGMGRSKNGMDLLTPSTAKGYAKIMGVQPSPTSAPSNTDAGGISISNPTANDAPGKQISPTLAQAKAELARRAAAQGGQ